MTPSELYTIIRNQCAEDSTEFWGEDEIYSLISTGEKILAQRLGMVEKNSSFTSTTNTKTYSIASNLCSTVGTITRLTYDSYRLSGMDINGLDDIEGKAYGGVTLYGNPTHYYRYGDELGFSPTPDAAKTISVYFNAVPATITTASTAFSIPSEYAEYIADYALYRMFMKDQELRSEAAAYKEQWDENIENINNERLQKKHHDVYPSVIINEAIVNE
jgi:hypothetical protein